MTSDRRAGARSRPRPAPPGATMKPSAPPPLPSRRPAPATRSLITMQASDGAEQRPSSAADAAPSSRKPATRPITAASSVIRPRAEPWCRWCRRASRSRCRCRASVRKSTCENLTAPAAPRRSATLPDDRSARAAPPAARPHPHPRPRALRRPVRRADQGDALLGDARPDGDHRAAGGDLARRRPAGHLDLPAAELRRADDADRPGVGGGGAPVRADRGLRGDQGLHPRGDGRRGDAPRPRGHDRHHRRPAGDRPGLQDAGRPRRRR